MRRLLLQAVKTVQEGRIPAGVRPSYYTLRAALEVLPRDADWREILAPDITPEKILQTV
jgi:phthalate 4,5-dioxygenase